ncbi:MAG: hypothetical protein R6V54_06595, partial [Desulfobacteraceae bacterium]
FAPVIPLGLYKEKLKEREVPESTINSKINSIKEQKVTSLFYLPKGGNLDSDHIVPLDDLLARSDDFEDHRSAAHPAAPAQSSGDQCRGAAERRADRDNRS